MSFRARLALLAIASVALVYTVVAACPSRPPPPPSSPTTPRTRSQDQGRSPGRASDRSQAAALPRGPDLSRELLAYLVVSDGQRLLTELGPRATRDASAADRQAAAAAAFGVDPNLARAVDLRRPAAIALLNPTLLASDAVRPYVALVPVASREAVEQALKQGGTSFRRSRWGLTITQGPAKVHVGFVDGYAVIGWRPEILAGVHRLLRPELARAPEMPLRVRLNMENAYAAFGPQLDAMLGQLGEMAEQGGSGQDPQVAFALRGMRQLTGLANSVRSLELLADVDHGGLTITVRVDGRGQGGWDSYVRQQRPGPAWGVEFLPEDAVLAFTTCTSPMGRSADLEASVEYVAASSRSPGVRSGRQRAQLRAALEQVQATTGGELAYAVWPGRSGGVGLGGAYRVTDAAAARQAVSRAYRALGKRSSGLVIRALQLDPKRFARRVRLGLRTVRVGGEPVELVEVGLRWPERAGRERHAFEAMFGPRLVLATAFVGEQAVFAAGADWQERIGVMIAQARGGEPKASMKDHPAFAAALGYHDRDRVSLAFLETGRTAELATSLMEQAAQLSAEEREAMGKLLGQVGAGAIVSTTNVSAGRYELTTHVPHAAIVGASGLSGALWRIALSPMLNPPVTPPLPVPPPHVTPGVRAKPTEPPSPSP